MFPNTWSWKIVNLGKQKQEAVGDIVSEGMICEKVNLLHDDLLKNKPAPSGESVEVFKARHGWFDNFELMDNTYTHSPGLEHDLLE